MTSAILNEDAAVAGIIAGDRTVLARTITMVESRRADHQALAGAVLARVLPRTGAGYRLGVTGVPGVGKSTFIDAFGSMLTGLGHKVAVLAVDPSSARTGGSILGDKTRMVRLATDAHAYIRPSPAGGTLGGVARMTRETMLLCEAAGFDVVIVETMGVGQSETAVAEMVDLFLVLALPGAGDALQGIKKGLIELADIIAVNKADGDGRLRAEAAAATHADALRIIEPRSAHWRPRVLTMSALDGHGLDQVWALVCQHRALLEAAGALEERRRQQQVRWLWSMLEDRLLRLFRDHPAVAAALPELERAVAAGSIPAALAAGRLLRLFSDAGGPDQNP